MVESSDIVEEFHSLDEEDLELEKARKESAIEVLKEMIERNLESAEYQKAVEEGILALEQKEKLIKLCNGLEADNKNELSKTLFGALIGTCKVKDVLGGKP